MRQLLAEREKSPQQAISSIIRTIDKTTSMYKIVVICQTIKQNYFTFENQSSNLIGKKKLEAGISRQRERRKWDTVEGV